MPSVHHLELWVPDLAQARPRWDWVLTLLGWADYQDWPNGHSWRAPDGSYLVVEESPDLSGRRHDRTVPGLNHVALVATTRAVVDAVTVAAPAHGWTLLFAERHPHAGGPDHYAAFLADVDGYELEVVADHA